MIEYKIISGFHEDVELEVNMLLGQNWKLYGTAGMMQHGARPWFSQVLIQEVEYPKSPHSLSA